jgi:hypothetical protein
MASALSPLPAQDWVKLLQFTPTRSIHYHYPDGKVVFLVRITLPPIVVHAGLACYAVDWYAISSPPSSSAAILECLCSNIHTREQGCG